MGRWVTSKGRRIYIPDEGEENPYAKSKGTHTVKVKGPRGEWKDYKSFNSAKEADEWLTKHIKENNYLPTDFLIKQNSQQSKDESTKQKQIASNKAQADERNKKSEKNTLENRNKLKQKIDDYVKSHPNPTAEDRRKVSEMRDKYDAMKKEAYDPIKKEQREKIAIIQNVKKNTVHRKQAIKDIYYKQELELYEKRKKGNK